MATETQIRVTRARYGGFMATFYWQGDWCRIFFENQLDLAQELVDAEVDRETRDAVIDTYEQLEWDATPEYPLGVVYVGNPMTSNSHFYAPFLQETPRKQAYFSDVDPSTFWDMLAASLRIGVVASPWVLLIVAAKWAGVL